MKIEDYRGRVVAQDSGCWTIPDLKARSDGYLRVRIDGKMLYLHRAFYEHLVGQIPPGMELDHACHTRDESCAGSGETCLHRRCVNPDHMEVVTRRENIKRSKVGVVNRTKGSCSRGHPYDDENTYARPDGGRDCRACRAMHARLRQERKKVKQ